MEFKFEKALLKKEDGVFHIKNLSHLTLKEIMEEYSTEDIYNEYVTKNGNSIKMRSADGIHFSTDGQKLIAQVISSHLKIIH